MYFIKNNFQHFPTGFLNDILSMLEESSKQQTGERSVNVYILSQSGCPKYQGKFDFRSFLMRIPDAIILPYSPIDHPFPFLDVITPDFNSFLILGDKTAKDNKSVTKEIHHIIWKQKDHYKYVPYLFNFPLKYTKGHLFKLMLIQPKDENQYELWKIRDHQLYERIIDNSAMKPDDFSQDGDKIPEFDSHVVMRIIPYENFIVRYHVRITFFYIGENPRYIGTPLIIGIDKPESINNLLLDFPKFAPKWVHDCEIRFMMKRVSDSNNNKQNEQFNYQNYIFDNNNPDLIPYFNIICKLIDKDYYYKTQNNIIEK